MLPVKTACTVRLPQFSTFVVSRLGQKSGGYVGSDDEPETAALAKDSETSKIVVPSFGDAYSLFVTKLESGQTDIDYGTFRESFLKSKQFEVASARHAELQQLRHKVRDLMSLPNYVEIAKVAKQMLSIDYTDMEAHKALASLDKAVGDEDGARKHHDIEIGLLKSIVRTGDGQSCGTAWQVVQIGEEYFILGVLGARLKQQSLDNKDGLCDRMDVTIEGSEKTFYFGVTKIFEKYKEHLDRIGK